MRRLLFILLLLAGAVWYLSSAGEGEEPEDSDSWEEDDSWDELVDDFPAEDFAGSAA